MPAPHSNRDSSGVLALTLWGWVWLLVGGISVTVLTAWLMPMLIARSLPNANYSNVTRPPQPWPDAVPATWPTNCDYMNSADSGVNRRTIASLGQPSATTTYYELTVHRVGFPMRALVRSDCVVRGMSPPGMPPAPVMTRTFGTGPNAVTVPIFTNIFDLSRGPWYDGLSIPMAPPFIPIRPLWPGFLINTLFYPAILYTLLVTKGSLTYSRRYFKRRCPTCGYDLKGLSTCPECGKLPVAPLSGP